MKIDYHMHFEYGSYDEDWAEGFGYREVLQFNHRRGTPVPLG